MRSPPVRGLPRQVLQRHRKPLPERKALELRPQLPPEEAGKMPRTMPALFRWCRTARGTAARDRKLLRRPLLRAVKNSRQVVNRLPNHPAVQAGEEAVAVVA